jgi:hypothetical protein
MVANILVGTIERNGELIFNSMYRQPGLTTQKLLDQLVEYTKQEMLNEDGQCVVRTRAVV